MSKRPGYQEPTHPPSAKKPKPSPGLDTPLAEQASSLLEQIPEDQLPDDVDALNARIHQAVEQTFPRGITSINCFLFIQTLSTHCDFIELPQNWVSLNLQVLYRILEMGQTAYLDHNYKPLMRLKVLQRAPTSSSGTSISSQAAAVKRQVVPAEVVNGWNARFIGVAHDALGKNIRDMYQAALKDDRSDCKYLTHAAIVQSSGSGKSRLVYELSEKMFTIPFNIRESSAATSSAWPPADNEIRDLLVKWANAGDEALLHARYLCFFTAVFEETWNAVQECLSQPTASQTARAELPSYWRTYLAKQETRDALYTKVVARSEELTEANKKEISKGLAERQVVHESLKKTAMHALYELLRAVCIISDCKSHTTDTPGLNRVQELHVLMYFDESHVLVDEAHRSRYNGKVALDILFNMLDEFRQNGLFTTFMSTQSHCLTSRAPSASTLARSARSRNLTKHMHAPITETPFDCFGDRRIVPSRLRAEDVSNIAFMACFGRPLWRSLLLPFTDQILEWMSSASGAPVLPPADDVQCQDLIKCARAKLLFDIDVDKARKKYPETARTALLDVRIMLSFEPGRSSPARDLEMGLVASHMRMVYSIPQHREYIRSGYPTEPILAEAAARQLHKWRTVANPPSVAAQDWRDPAVRILRDDLDHNLLNRGEVGEAVGRVVLTNAHDRAVFTSFPNQTPPHFSLPVPVVAFFKELFCDNIAEEVLKSKPDNLPSTVTFADAFKDAVLNFTHFGKWSDDSAPNEVAAVGCFVRSMAVICRNNAPKVDAFLPVLLNKSAPLRPENMTGILIQFKRRKKKGPKAAYAIDQKDVRLFNPPATPAAGDQAPLPRPYITLIMELGVPDSDLPASPADAHSKSRQDPSPVDVGIPPSYASNRNQEVLRHPRYSMTAYGCSHKVYGVIGKCDSDVYKKILCKGDLFEEHPRPDPTSLDFVRTMKPVCSLEDASWDSWIVNE